MVSHSALETRQFGERLAAFLAPGDVVLLTGEMGAGKSVLARGIAQGLGVEGAMPSPTFTYLQPYEGRIKLYHFDLYRLDDADTLYAMGLHEFIGGDGVALIEWPERCPEALPERHLTIRLEYGPTEEDRAIALEPCGGFPDIKEVDLL